MRYLCGPVQLIAILISSAAIFASNRARPALSVMGTQEFSTEDA
jgi:hypothetical protein